VSFWAFGGFFETLLELIGQIIRGLIAGKLQLSDAFIYCGGTAAHS